MQHTMATRLDQRISLLSREDQLWLIERVVHRLRTPQPVDLLKQELHAMVHDPEIQQELHAINVEFLTTETDGLA